MDIVIIVSEKDIAGMNIRKKLILKNRFKSAASNCNKQSAFIHSKTGAILYTIKEDSIHAAGLNKTIAKNADLVIFATRHKGKDKRPVFSCHTQGNWSDASDLMGGKSRELGICPANVLKKAFLLMQKLKQDYENLKDFEITLECTHHGPSLAIPSVFIEIGSAKEQWGNDDASDFIADVILNLAEYLDNLEQGDLTKKRPENKENKNDNNNANKSEIWNNKTAAFGIGGPHYCGSFNKVMQKSSISVGHICPKHMLHALDLEMIKQAIDKTIPKAEYVILDWKGLGNEKQRIISILEGAGIKYIKTKDAIIKYPIQAEA